MGFSLLLLFISLIISAILVVNTINPVHSVFFLILTFLFGSIFLFLLRNEFLSIIFIVVYIGAIVVLFLFVIMMLNIKLIELKASYIAYIPLSFIFILIFFFEMIFFMDFSVYNNLLFVHLSEYYVVWINYLYFSISNVHIVGLYLYTYYVFFFVLSGVILFIATIGSILITFVSFFPFKTNYNKRHQYVMFQYYVDYSFNLKNYNLKSL